MSLSSQDPDKSCHSLSVDFSNTTWAQRGLINRLPGNAYGSQKTKVPIKNHYQHSTTFGAVTRIKPKKKYPDNYGIAFGTTNMVVYYGITFGAGNW